MTLFILVFIFLIIFFIGSKKSVFHKSFFRFGFLSLSVLIILEFTLFNFRFYESLFFHEINTNKYNYGEGLQVHQDGSIEVIEKKLNYIEVTNIGHHLSNIYLDFDMGEDTKRAINVSVGYTDSANSKYSYAQERTISARDGEDGEYLRYHLSGRTNRVRIYVNTLEEEETFRIREISFNKQVPFTISCIRPIFLLSFLLLIYIFRPKSSLYRLKMDDGKTKQVFFIAVLCEILFLGVLLQFNYYFVKEKFDKDQPYQRIQYQLLTEAFLKGQTYLDIEPSEILKNLRNPYDKKLRAAAFKDQEEENFIWDAAFYNNKYYVYFGVAPVITYYLPMYLLTGHHIKTATCIFITAIATVIGVFLLLHHLVKKYFKNVSVGAFLAISLLFINACGILAIVGRPDHYSLPILMAIMFSIYGLFWWIKAKENDLNGTYLFLGSLCMAAVSACRPQLLLTSLFAFPIFWSDVKKKELFSKKSLRKTILFAFPYIVIALLLMWYNYTRFGSPIDFGANYNLTTNDMRKRGFVLGRIPLGIYYYLLNPFSVVLKFPFILRNPISTNYVGTTIFEDMNGGFIIVNLLTIFGILIFKYKEEIKSKMLYQIGFLSVIFTFLIIIVDTQMAGILPRYFCDFGFLLYLSSSIVLFHLLNKLSDNKKKALLKIIYVCFLFGILYNFLLVLSDSTFMVSPFFFYLRRLFEFWV